MSEIFVDTDILIDYSKGHSRLLKNLLLAQERGEAELFVNAVVVAEFMNDRSLEDDTRHAKAQEFLQFFSLKDITKRIGFLAGEFLRGDKVSQLGDAMIAATCVVHNIVLATRNSKHFRKISSLQFYHV